MVTMKKIISLSSYGTNPRYVVGMHRQHELAKVFYPNWEFRAYVDDASRYNLPGATIIEVTDGSHGVFWRFEPFFEDENNIVIVRDADDRISLRECAAVREWIASEKKFHALRDHEAHFQFPLMAGTLGCKGKLPEHLREVMLNFSRETSYYTNDQVFLRDYVWPLVEKEAMMHSLNEGWFAETRKRLKNPFAFCGNGYDEFDMPIYPDTLAKFDGFDPKALGPQFKYDYGFLNE